MRLDRSTGVSLKVQIIDALREEIDPLDHSEKIPSEEDLSKKFGVSRGTVRSAVSELVRQGQLYKLQGKGTFKCGTTLYNSGQTLTSLTDQLLSQGFRPGIKEKSLKYSLADQEISDLLKIKLNDPVWRISRLRSANDLLLSFNIAYISKSVIPDLKDSDFTMSLVDMITNKFMIRLIKAENYCYATCADEFLSSRLNVKIGTPILKIQHIAYGVENEKPIYLDFVYAIGDRQFLRFEQSNFLWFMK